MMFGKDFLQAREFDADTSRWKFFRGGILEWLPAAHQIAGEGRKSFPMPHRPHFYWSPITLALALAITQAGCVALNIPSRRHLDPSDDGGLFGSWNGGDGTNGSESLHVHSEGCPCEGSFDACVGDCGDCEWGCGIDETVRPPEIPWPRFHPVPTRPIFGPPPAPAFSRD